MKIKKLYLNIFLSVVSLIIVGVYFLNFYKPVEQRILLNNKNIANINQFKQKANARLEEFNESQQNLELPQTEDFEQMYKNKVDELDHILPEKIYDSDIFFMLDELSKETKVDLSNLNRVVASTPSNAMEALEDAIGNMVSEGYVTNTEDPNGIVYSTSEEEAQKIPEAQLKTYSSLEEAGLDGKTPSPYLLEQTATNQEPSTISNSGSKTYSMKLKGEYRSIMMFMYKLQNQKMLCKITGFELKYNSSVYNDGIFSSEAYDGKNKDYPLQAVFKVTFYTSDSI